MFRFFRRNREAVKRYLLIFFLSIVSIGMVITLAPIPGGDTSRQPMGTLARIGGETISTQDLDRSIRARLQGMGANTSPQLVSFLAGRILDQMVVQRAVQMQAKKLGLEVTNQEVLQALQALPFLYSNGAFIGMDRYQDIIQQQTGMPVSQFEQELRENILMEKVHDVVTDGAQVTPREVHDEFLRRNGKTKIEYVVFDPAQFVKAVDVTGQGLEAYFKSNAERYKVPEERRVRYLIVDADHVRSRLKLAESDLRDYYRQHLSDYHVPERVKVSHILFKTEGKSPQEIATIEKTARDVLAKIRAGADFAEMAKKNSEDSSAANGGDLGWVVRGQTVKEFENAAFTMKPGQVSDLIKTTYGFHILKVFDHQQAHLQPFDEVKTDIRNTLEKQQLDTAQQSLAQEIEDRLRQNPKGFDSVAKQFGLETKETPLFRFNQAVPDLGNNEALENLAFSLQTGEIGQPITVPKGVAIIEATEIAPEHPPRLDEVRAKVEEDYRQQQAKTLALQKAQQFAAQAKTGDFKKLGEGMKLAVKESKDFSQQDDVEGLGPASSLTTAFTLAPGQTSEVVNVGTKNVVFRVVSRTPADEASFAAQRDQIREELLDRERSLEFEAYQRNLKRQMEASGELKMNDAALKQFIASYQR